MHTVQRDNNKWRCSALLWQRTATNTLNRPWNIHLRHTNLTLISIVRRANVNSYRSLVCDACGNQSAIGSRMRDSVSFSSIWIHVLSMMIVFLIHFAIAHGWLRLHNLLWNRQLVHRRMSTMDYNANLLNWVPYWNWMVKKGCHVCMCVYAIEWFATLHNAQARSETGIDYSVVPTTFSGFTLNRIKSSETSSGIFNTE